MLKLHEFTENINKTPYKGKLLQHEPMAPKTTMKTGGTAALFLIPQDEKSLLIAVTCLKTFKIPFFILGGGSNVIPPDGELEAAVISTEAFKGIEIIKEESDHLLIKCGAGTLTNDLVDFCSSHGISGLETFAGLPGTTGGAAYMNARCYSKEMSQVISDAEFLNLETIESIEKINDFSDNFIERHLKMYHNNLLSDDWAYKKSPFTHKNTVITSLTFKTGKADKTKEGIIRAECEKYVDDRRQKGHFKAPSAGSVFKNDRNFGNPSGYLIDKAGLKGTESGGAQIAPWHGNIIINKDNAKSADIKNLVQIVQDKVLQETGFLLEPEIIFIEQNLQ